MKINDLIIQCGRMNTVKKTFHGLFHSIDLNSVELLTIILHKYSYKLAIQSC